MSSERQIDVRNPAYWVVTGMEDMHRSQWRYGPQKVAVSYSMIGRSWTIYVN